MTVKDLADMTLKFGLACQKCVLYFATIHQNFQSHSHLQRRRRRTGYNDLHPRSYEPV